LENLELVTKVRQVETLLKEAKEHYDQSESLIEEAFTLISTAVIPEGDSPFRRERGEEHRRLAIRGVAAALEVMDKDDLTKRLKRAISEVYHILTFIQESKEADVATTIIGKAS